jgi:hypothetical protein
MNCENTPNVMKPPFHTAALTPLPNSRIKATTYSKRTRRETVNSQFHASSAKPNNKPTKDLTEGADLRKSAIPHPSVCIAIFALSYHLVQ